MLKSLKLTDPELYDITIEEFERQQQGIEMIASESYVPPQILELQGSIFTNKTMEGFPGKRYHAGYHVIDKMERLGIQRAKDLYGAEHANIQPHSGSSANQSVYSAMLNPGDTILGMKLDHGGHLTHGSKVNFSGKIYNFISYGLNKETEEVDYQELEAIAKKYKPKMIVAGASAYSRTMDYEKISSIAKSVNAYFLYDMAHIAGLVATKIVESPVKYADFVTSTTTKTLAGARGGFILCKKEYANKIDKAVFPGNQGSAHLHIMAAKTFTFKRAMSDEYKDTMRQVVKNAKQLAKTLRSNGFKIITGDTDNHLLLVDLRPKNLTGKQMEKALETVGITVNKNMIPYDPENPMITSGIRIGTTAVTIRGMKESDLEKIGILISEVAENINNDTVLDEIKRKGLNISEKYPLYQEYFSKIVGGIECQA